MAGVPLYFAMSTGFVLAQDADGTVGIAGSCACYRRRDVLVTAAHCVPEAASELYVVLPGEPKPRPVLRVERHETSDVAVVIAQPREDEPLGTQVYEGIDDTLTEGGDFMAYGYPVEAAASPVGRLFKGHFQRYMSYEDAAGHGYFAGELSIPAPAGLSGGPVVRTTSPSLLTAVVTQNVESYVVLDSLEEVERDGKTLRVESRRVVNYGIAAMLTSDGPWLDGIVSETAGAPAP